MHRQSLLITLPAGFSVALNPDGGVLQLQRVASLWTPLPLRP